MLVSTALVMLMTPGLALFYGGMVRRKNVLSTAMYSFIALGVISIQWVLFGYSLSFGPDIGPMTGGLAKAGLHGVAGQAMGTIPEPIFMMFQMMFAIITAALISGAVAERMKFSAYVVFIILWTTLVYDPLAHWVWGGGWIMSLGALDFAGGLVVHISSGVAALACAIVLGKRHGYPAEPMAPHNLTMTLMGAALLWFGWFGFNAGSALTSGGLAATAFVATHVATAAASLGWVAAEWAHRGKPTALGAASGMVAGLVAITPGAGFVGPLASIVIGLMAGLICYTAVMAKGRLGYDDALDAFGIHGVGGAWGALATGLFASLAVNAAGGDGLIYGNLGLGLKQALSVLATASYTFVVTLVILKAVDMTIGLRVEREDEIMGLDLSQHGESGYSM
ncbi:MAG: ammonium transporter [Nitrospinota bacterium]|nr:ammonium transporter [Nitrospinota bacterium]